jgi:hypothetical protein
VIYRPSNFDPSVKYPVIENIYAGPHSSFVPKAFAAYNQMQSLAEIGFVVVQIDGMGTSNRSKAFHDVARRTGRTRRRCVDDSQPSAHGDPLRADRRISARQSARSAGVPRPSRARPAANDLAAI